MVSGTKSEEGSQIQKLKRKLKPEQRRLLNAFWQEFRESGKWPTSRSVHSQNGGKHDVKKCLERLGGSIVFEIEDRSPGNRYQLTIIGVLLTDAGEEYRGLLVKYFDFLRAKLKGEPDRYDFTDKEIGTELHLSESERDILGKLISIGQFFSSAGFGGELGAWSIRAPDMIEDLPMTGPLDREIDKILNERYDPKMPVSLEDKKKQQSSFYNVYNLPVALQGSVPEPPPPVTVDSLKRRYQVFVSSTYEDLKEERQYVIQSLLETKCVPTGMELFPAASVEQWELIKRIIQECDYYIVIIAGRYGTVNKKGISYTEMEFDFALEIGKPVIGFYHRNPKNLPGEKLEETDKGRKRLAAFTEKVKQRLCRPWASPAELGSGVKSAIFSELETNPRPGWIRADSVPASDVVEKLKQRIVDLEERLKRKKPIAKSPFLNAERAAEIPFIVRYDFQMKPHPFYDDHEERTPQQELEHSYKMPWDQLVALLAHDLQVGATLERISGSIRPEIYDKAQSFCEKSAGVANPEFEWEIPRNKLEKVLKTLMAKKLVKMRVGAYGNWTDPFWQFTSKGLQYLAEIQSVA